MHRSKPRKLPVPPKHKAGWPWTEEGRGCLPETMPDGRQWPKISIVTPSYNQGQYIEETIRSVLLQGYPNLEYIIIDGGSTDQSVDIIKKYEPWLTYWVSEPDNGQSDAINRGFRKATGVFGNWINSDDMLCRNALVNLATHAQWNALEMYIGVGRVVDQRGKTVTFGQGKVHTFKDLVSLTDVWWPDGYIFQPAVLFPLQLFQVVGGLDVGEHLAMDYKLWGQFLLHGATFKYLDVMCAIFRNHDVQKTSDLKDCVLSTTKVAEQFINGHEMFSEEYKKAMLSKLTKYVHGLFGVGYRLERMGVPTSIINVARSIKAALRGSLRLMTYTRLVKSPPKCAVQDKELAK